MKRFTILAVAILAVTVLGFAQAAPAAPAPTQAKKQPQAKSQPEFQAYQKFWNAQDADEKIKSAEEFLKAFPETELKIYAYMAEMQSYQVKNDFPHLREFGEKILDLDPGDLPTLITLATAIPERTQETDLDKDQKRTQAEGYAKKALESVDKLEKPANVADAVWNERVNDARSQAHYALGLVALQRKSYQGAIDEMMLAAKLQSPSQPDPILWWRLGMANELAKKYDEALKAFEKSVALGGVKIDGKDRAAEDRDRIKKFLDGKK
jgi:tetratricopeptide (TPR) repeat protein